MEEEDGEQSDVVELAKSVIKDIVDGTLRRSEHFSSIYERVDEQDQLTAFMRSMIAALADDIAAGDREYVPRTETYCWMAYFFLHFCGFQFFLDNLEEMKAAGSSVEEAAEIIVELIDRVAESEYLHADSDLAEHVAKNVVWRIMNSPAMRRRYEGQSVSYCDAGDILDATIEAAMALHADSSNKQHVNFVDHAEEEPAALVEQVMIPEVCREFLGIFNVAEHFVDGILTKSRALTYHAPVPEKPASHQELINIERLIRAQVPTIQSFTIDSAAKALVNILNLWQESKFQEDWCHTTRYVMSRSDACSDFHTYESKFGLPTHFYPIPQATCSVLLRLEVSRVKPPECPIAIRFTVEGSGCVHDIEEHELEERWLLNVINAKVRLFSRVHF